jgi:hypothetical protein
MTTLSHEQSVLFNQVRCGNKRREEIAIEIMQRQMDVDERQAKVQKIADKMAKMQKDVAKKQEKVTKQHEEIAREEAKISREQAEVAHEQEEISDELAEIANEQEMIAQEQAEIIQAQTEITEGQQEIAREQTAICRVSCDMTKLSTVDAELQTDVVDSLNALDEYGALKPMLIEFDGACRTICCGKGNSLKLTKVQYDIFDLLYHAPACQMPILSLEDKVWGEGSMPTTATVKMAVSRLNQELRAANFPFEVTRIKRDLKTTPAINPITGKTTVDFIVQPEIEIYELVCK